MQAPNLRAANDTALANRYAPRVTHSRPKRFTNWFLRDWMTTLGVSQTELIERTGLSKTAISLLVNDRQAYTPEIVRDVALALNIAAHELLMEPADAMSLRALRSDALRIVARDTAREEAIGRDQRTGTDG